MPKTISFHTGSAWSRGHNIRDERYTKNQEHINAALSANNVTLRDVPVRQAYEEIFAQAVQEYNDKQRRNDRKIKCYYDKMKKAKRKKPVYECIVQIGDKDDTGNSAELEKQALIRFAKEWDSRNPNLRLIGAYIHADEPNGTVHLHCDYIPVAECTSGMRLQNSYDKALQQQGFKTINKKQTAQIAWQDREREAVTAICRDLGIDAQHSQGIGKGREYLTPKEYQRAKDKMAEQIETVLQPLRTEMQEYVELQIPIRAVDLDKKKIPFSKRVSVDADELNKLIKQARAYTANRNALVKLKDDQKSLVQGQQELAAGKVQLEADRKQFDAKCKETMAELDAERAKVQEMYNRQLNLNKLHEQTESELKEEQHESIVLHAQNNILKREVEGLKEGQKTLIEDRKEAYICLANVVKAIGMLKYGEKGGDYRIEDLSPTQARLIDAIAKYGEICTERKRYPDLVKDIKEHVGISKGISDCIDELTPKRRRSREKGDFDLG